MIRRFGWTRLPLFAGRLVLSPVGGISAIAWAAPKPINMTVIQRRNALLLFATLQGLDFLTTVFVLRHGGPGGQVARRAAAPWAGIVLAVLLSKMGMVWVAWRFVRRGWILYAGNALYVAVVSWNGWMAFLALR